MTDKQFREYAMSIIRAGKAGQPMPPTLPGKERWCEYGYKLGQMYAALERVKS
jgi:hypothetical protein